MNENIDWVDVDVSVTGCLKPDITGLSDAFENIDGEYFPLFGVNDFIWIERVSTIFQDKWFETSRFRVMEVNQSDHLLTLWNEELEQHCMSHWDTGLKRGNLYKLSTVAGKNMEAPKTKAAKKLEARTDVTLEVKKGRGRPKGSKNKSVKVKLSKPESETKRGRGRPKGSKNKKIGA